MNSEIKMIVAAVAGALVVDLRTYYKAKKADPKTTFRWDLFAIRAFEGLFTGLSAVALTKASGG